MILKIKNSYLCIELHYQSNIKKVYIKAKNAKKCLLK